MSCYRDSELYGHASALDMAFSTLEAGKEERKEPEMSNYTKSAEIAGKLLGQMEEAGCKTSSVTLYADGTGEFTVNFSDLGLAQEIVTRHLPFLHPFTEFEGRYSLGFATYDLEGYISVCHTCKRPLEEELLREGECSHSNCVEEVGHGGLHSGEYYRDRNYCLCCGSRAEPYGSASLNFTTGIAQSCTKETCVPCLEGGCSNCFGSKLAQPAGEWHEGCGHEEKK